MTVTSNYAYISESQQGVIKEKQHAQKQEHGSKASEADTDLAVVTNHGCRLGPPRQYRRERVSSELLSDRKRR